MKLKQLDAYKWEVPRTGAMRVPGIVYASPRMLEGPDHSEPLKQVSNVATLPGILKASLAMPDMHWGYGFPIGGLPPSTGKPAWCHPAVSATILTAGYGWQPPGSRKKTSGRS